VGNIDVTTLEGLLIKNRIQTLPKPQQKKLKKAMVENRRKKERHDIARCPFLQKNKTCMIYEARPFTCRKLYSLKPCEDRGPTLHRDVMVMAQKTVLALQSLDDHGYSGHISYILYLLEQPAFMEEYLSGRFNPAAIMSYGKAHGIIINQMAAGV
jgi:hypothetical protein